MKKLLSFLFLLTGILLHAQFSIVNQATNTPINDGDVIIFNQYSDNNTGDHSGNLEVIITNNDTSNPIQLYLEAQQLINTDGSMFLHCWDMCRSGISAHTPYGPISIDAGASTPSDAIHFENFAAGTDPNANVDYVLKIYQLDAQNNEVASVTFTYRYTPGSGGIIKQLKQDEFQLSVSYGMININSKYPAKVSIYNLTGQKVKEISVNKGKSTLNTNNFTKGIYIIRAMANNKEMYQRVIIN